MSVYTKITEDELSEHLEKYTIGVAIDLTGISDGIENTNYLLKTNEKEYIFTIFENLSEKDILQYLEFMNHLSNKGLLCPKVIESKNNDLYISIKGKPSAIIEKLEGKSLIHPGAKDCALIGDLLGKFHNYGADFNTKLINSRNLDWCRASFKKLDNFISDTQSGLISDALDSQNQMERENLPIGTIHADLFRDNVLFNKNNISGMIDFYYSCKGFLIYDLAVVVNDWCSDGNGRIINDSLVSLLSAYNNQRVIQDNEKKYWRHALISASLRFYLSRLIDLHYPKIGEMTHIKDPNIFENILIDRIKKSHEIKV